MFYPRITWGARAARSGPGRLDKTEVVGLAFHWPGMTQPLTTVKDVKAALRGWQAYHMDTKGWSDIAYQAAIDQAGNWYQLRGLKTQSGANGDTDVNEAYGAVLLVLAPGERPSPAMTKTVRRLVRRHRRIFRKSTALPPHSGIHNDPTDCPGDIVRSFLAAGVFEPTTRKANR